MTEPPPPIGFNRPNLEVNCLADGVLVNVGLVDDRFKGVMYVKGHSNDERCRQSVNFLETGRVPVDFKVQFGVCGLFHSDVSPESLYVDKLFTIFSIAGRSQLYPRDPETSQACHLQVSGLQDPVCVQHWNTAD